MSKNVLYLLQGIMKSFRDLCDLLELNPSDHRNIYTQLKSRLRSWKAASLWAKLDKRASQRDYQRQQACQNMRVSGLFHCIDYIIMDAMIVLMDATIALSMII